LCSVSFARLWTKRGGPPQIAGEVVSMKSFRQWQLKYNSSSNISTTTISSSSRNRGGGGGGELWTQFDVQEY
jgi:hypothetical protein